MQRWQQKGVPNTSWDADMVELIVYLICWYLFPKTMFWLHIIGFFALIVLMSG